MSTPEDLPRPSGGPAPPLPRAPRHRVHPRAIAWWTVRSAAGLLVTLAALAVAALLLTPIRGWLVAALVVVAVAGLAHAAVMPQWRYRVHRWEVAAEAVYTRSGWINQEWRIAPMSRIQTVDTARGPLQRALRLASVTVTTASAAGPITIEGLDRQVAERLVAQLTETTQATPGDAT